MVAAAAPRKEEPLEPAHELEDPELLLLVRPRLVWEASPASAQFRAQAVGLHSVVAAPAIAPATCCAPTAHFIVGWNGFGYLRPDLVQSHSRYQLLRRRLRVFDGQRLERLRLCAPPATAPCRRCRRLLVAQDHDCRIPRQRRRWQRSCRRRRSDVLRKSKERSELWTLNTIAPATGSEQAAR